MSPTSHSRASIARTVLPLQQVILRALHSSTQRCSPVVRQVSSAKPTSANSLLRAPPPHVSAPGQQGKGRYEKTKTSGRILANVEDWPKRSSNRAGGPAPVIDPNTSDEANPLPHKSYAVFTPTTYALPRSVSSPSDAAAKSFDQFEVHPQMIPAVHQRFGDYAKTTPIQSLAFRQLLPFAEPKQRVLLGAETGSGKTLAYLIPLMTNLKLTEDPEDRGRFDESRQQQLLPRSIILSPTHELTRQITGTAKGLVHKIKLSVLGMSNTKDGGIGLERGGKDILCGTVAMTRRMLGVKKPGDEDREDRTKRAWVSAKRLDWIVIDEADVLLGRDFQEETLAVLEHIMTVRPNISIVLCTATVPPALLELTETHPIFSNKQFNHILSPNLHRLPASLEARYVKYKASNNPLTQVALEMRRVMAEDGRARTAKQEKGEELNRSKYVVFCNTDKKVAALQQVFEDRQLPSIAWTGEAETRKRGTNGLLQYFLLEPKAKPEEAMIPVPQNEKAPRILITTSILSRGLDFHPAVSTVFLVDEPRDILDFVHRAGRAGRAGRNGRVVVFGQSVHRGGGRDSLTKRIGALTAQPKKLKPQDGGLTFREIRASKASPRDSQSWKRFNRN